MLNRPSATHSSQIFLHFHSISLRWPIYIINSRTFVQTWPSERTWLGLSTRLPETIWLIFWLFYTSYEVKHRRKICWNHRHLVPASCDLRARKAGAYQRLLTSKYFLRSMRKQNAPLTTQRQNDCAWSSFRARRNGRHNISIETTASKWRQFKIPGKCFVFTEGVLSV